MQFASTRCNIEPYHSTRLGVTLDYTEGVHSTTLIELSSKRAQYLPLVPQKCYGVWIFSIIRGRGRGCIDYKLRKALH